MIKKIYKRSLFTTLFFTTLFTILPSFRILSLYTMIFLLPALLFVSGCESQIYSKYYMSEHKADLHVYSKSIPVYRGEEFISARAYSNEYWHQSTQACVESISSFEKKKFVSDVI